MQFTKPAASSDNIVKLLRERGLDIPDEQEDIVISHIEHIGYFRLTGYMYPFQVTDGSHKFKETITFQRILDNYQFDKDLKFLLLSYIETFEVSLRSMLGNKMALAYGPHWYLDQNYFVNPVYHSEMVVRIQDFCSNASEKFIKAYISKYSNPQLPPCWMILETLTFGELSSLYENLKGGDEKTAIAAFFGTVPPLFESWLKSINFVRNCCAHHSRLWNRKLPLKPKIPTRKDKKFLNKIDEHTDKNLYGVLSCMLRLFENLDCHVAFKTDLKNLFSKYPMVNKHYMGFHDEWEIEPIWK